MIIKETLIWKNNSFRNIRDAEQGECLVYLIFKVHIQVYI